MHDYSINKHPKEKILFFLAFGAIACAPLVNRGLSVGLEVLGVQLGWAKAPVLAIPTFTLFALLYLGFNRYLWRVPWLRRFLLVPDLNGTWSCRGVTVRKNGDVVENEWPGTMTITQSWSKILIHLKTEQSSSVSTAASIQHQEGVGYTMLYQYTNSPSADAHDLLIHSGSVEIRISLDDCQGHGHYFTDHHRSTVGTLTISKD